MAQDDYWKLKLAAWLHDPAEKALVLLRGVSHEKVTVDKVLKVCFPDGIAPKWKKLIGIADHWASGADRPTLPLPRGERYPDWLAVKFWEPDQAEIIHPLSGQKYRLGDLYQDSLPNLEKLSLETYLDLVAPETYGKRYMVDSPKKAFLKLWRLLPEFDPLQLGHLWRLLPADTRVPTHTIWDHLSLTSAIASAMAGDPKNNMALMAVSLGPVQSFIQKARSSSDLWAGSHFLSYLSWKAMEVVCKQLGPDSILFPRLWGIPIVDLWIQNEGVSFDLLRDRPRWMTSASDSNPLFIAALPNRFVAILSSANVQEVAKKIIEEVTREVRELTISAAIRLVGSNDIPQVMREQINAQTNGFPELHWGAVSFSPLMSWDDEGVLIQGSEKALEDALTSFFELGLKGKPGFFGGEQWSLLCRPIGKHEDVFFYRPNPGVLYPAIYQLLDRVLAASKTTRPFRQMPQDGFRCSLCGEMEWLATERRELLLRPGQRTQTLWATVAQRNPSWARRGEHLCAICSIKRLWPTLFCELLENKANIKVDRYVISTHTMALATDLQDLLQDPEGPKRLEGLNKWRTEIRRSPRVAMPLKLHRTLESSKDLGEWRESIRKLPSYFDSLRELEASGGPGAAEGASKNREKLEEDLKKVFGQRPEAYYSILLMDGDHIGAWVSGTPPARMLRYEQLFHTKTFLGLRELAEKDGSVANYMKGIRSPSPAYHSAVSSALNGFALYVVPYVVEELYMGKLLYAGGDDVLALMGVDDCLEAALTLRCAFSGVVPGSDKEAVWSLLRWLNEQKEGLKGQIGKGFVMVSRKLLPMMGPFPAASIGLVIAHHTTPFQLVLREARKAEHMAKEAGRDRLGISLLKRAGGISSLVVPFAFGSRDEHGEQFTEPAGIGTTPMGILLWLRDMLARKGMSRRAAYNSQEWLKPLRGFPATSRDETERFISSNLSWQMNRQWSGSGFVRDEIGELCAALASVAIRVAPTGKAGSDPFSFLYDLFSVAEFLARQGRTRKLQQDKQ